MKKLFALAVSSLAAVGMAAGQAAAWGGHCCGGCKCAAVITCHQYNAFSPCCPDGISFQGCCPMPFGYFNQQNPGCAGPSCEGPCCDGFDGSYLGTLPPAGVILKDGPADGKAADGKGAPAQGAPTFQAPMPAPADGARSYYNGGMPVAPYAMMPPYGGPAGYPGYAGGPMAYPGYAGGPMMPGAMPAGGMVPTYWNPAAMGQ